MEERDAVFGCEARIVERKASNAIKSYEDLDVYQTSYRSMLTIFKQVLPLLPTEDRFDLTDQLRRSCKAIPRLIAEGHSKRHQVRGFQKYIDDAHAEANETIVSLNQVKDLYPAAASQTMLIGLIDQYDKISRQLFNLSNSWKNFSKYRR
jgi:four helix bundle protein